MKTQKQFEQEFQDEITPIQEFDIKPPEYVYMVYEENKTWAVPKRPKFTISCTRDEITKFLEDLNRTRSDNGVELARDSVLVAEQIRLFTGVRHYKLCERAMFEYQILSSQWQQNRIKFIDKK